MDLDETYARRVQPFLRPDEELQAAENVVCVATGRGLHAHAPGAAGVGWAVGGTLGDRLGRVGAVKGAPESVARSIPYRPGGLVLGVTETRVGLWTGAALGGPGEVWSASREIVARVERRPRLQLLARFCLHFVDGSSTAFMTPKGKTIERLGDLLGR